MSRVRIVRAEPKAPLTKRRFPFDVFTPPPTPGSLTVFKTRRIAGDPDEPFFVVTHKPDAWRFAVPPPPGMLTVFKTRRIPGDPDEPPFVIPPSKWKAIFSQGNAQLVLLGSGPGPGVVGIPTVTGGAFRLQIFIAGTEVTNPLAQDRSLVYGVGEQIGAQPLRIYSQTIGRGQATFDLYDPNFDLDIELGQTVLIVEGSLRLFAGCISLLAPEIFEGNPFRIWHITAVDKSGIFDHRTVLAPFYLAGTDAADVIRDLFTNPSSCNPPLSLEGITLNNLPATLGPLSSDLSINKQTVTQVINSVTTNVGAVWWIDTTSDLHAVFIPDLGTAPFGLTATSGNFRRAAMTATLQSYRNKEYVVSDRAVTPGPNSTGIVGTPITETWTLPQQLANDLGYLPLSIVTNFPMLKVTELKVNLVPQAVYIGTTFPPINFRHVWWYFPQTNYLIPPNAANANPFADPSPTSADPSPGDVVEISYIAPQQNAQVVTQDPLAPSFGTCGSGVYEYTDQVKGIVYQSDLNAFAQAFLARFGVIPKSLTFETDKPGLFVGQRLPVNLPHLDLSPADVMLITTVDMTALEGILEFSSRFRATVTATNTADQGNYIAWWEALVGRTENATPVPRYEQVNFVLGGGGSISAGVVQSNPYVVQNTGQVFIGYAIALNAPLDQDLTLDIVSAAQGSIFSNGPTPLIIPAGSTSLVKISQFTDDPAPFYLYKDDTLTAVATYSSLGASPVPASQVTLGLRISY